MNCSPTITAEDFRTIHNALCDIDSVAQHLESVLNPELYLKLVKARNDIREGLKDAYDQDARSFDAKYNHYDDVRAQMGLKESVWSIFDVEDLTARHPFEGADRVVYSDHWGKHTVSSSVHGSTYAALYRAANECIANSGDKHHIYIERFVPDKDDPRTLILSTGS